MSETIKQLKHYQMYVNGEFKDSKSGKLLTVINPSTGEKISTVPSATREETQEAINDAYEAEKTWKFVPAATRGQYLHDVASAIRDDSEHLIDMLQEEQGKIRSLAKTEILFSADYFDYMASAARTYEGEILQSDNFEMLLPLNHIQWEYPDASAALKSAPLS